MNSVCQNCGSNHDGKYASGRFCRKECARAFSTKNAKKWNKHYLCSICNTNIIRTKHGRNIPSVILCNDCSKLDAIQIKTKLYSI